ncbi:MAG TPA: PorV/PorQ family protein [Gemmatimonadales bacterium]|nr:PorV/PorQ family protein [Gemmatimonadales bacterium]
MTKTLPSRLVLLAALLGSTAQGLAAQAGTKQDNTAYGTTSAEFLLLGAGARGTALGGAYTAIANDVSALYYNPAGAALMTRPGVMVGTYDYVADTRYSWGGIAFPFGGGSKTFGVQVGTFGFKDQPVYTAEQPDGTGATYDVSETFVGLSYAQNFSDRFSAGITAKYISDNLGDATGQAFAIDFGSNFHAALNGHPVKFSFVLSNLGTNVAYSGNALNATVTRDPPPGEDPVPSVPQPSRLRTKAFPLPTTFRVGLAYDLLTSASNRLTVLSDFNQPNNSKAGFSGGVEWSSRNLGGSPFSAAVRGSYSYYAANNIKPSTLPTAMSDEENLQGLAAGGGLSYGQGTFNLSIDYAFKYMGILGPTHFVSLGLGW